MSLRCFPSCHGGFVLCVRACARAFPKFLCLTRQAAFNGFTSAIHVLSLLSDLSRTHVLSCQVYHSLKALLTVLCWVIFIPDAVTCIYVGLHFQKLSYHCCEGTE